MTIDALYPIEEAAVVTPATDPDGETAHELEHETQRTDKAIDKFIEQYRGRPRMAAWLASYTDEIQQVEDAIWDTRTKRMLDIAVDAQLDVLGEIVGQPRNGLADDEYRTWIRARIAVNNSDGLTSDLILILRLVIDDALAAIYYQDYAPASALIELLEDIGDLNPAHIQQLLQEAIGAGIALMFVYSYSAESVTFQLANANDVLASDVDKGLGNTEDSGTGGHLAGVQGGQ